MVVLCLVLCTLRNLKLMIRYVLKRLKQVENVFQKKKIDKDMNSKYCRKNIYNVYCSKCEAYAITF